MKKMLMLLFSIMMASSVNALAAGSPFKTFFDVQQGSIDDLLGPATKGPVPAPTLAAAELSSVYTNFIQAISAMNAGESPEAQRAAIASALRAAARVMANHPDPMVRRDAALVLRNAQAKLGLLSRRSGGGGGGGANPGTFQKVDRQPEPPAPRRPGGDEA